MIINKKGSVCVSVPVIAWREQSKKDRANLHNVYVLVTTRLTRTRSTNEILPDRFEIDSS